jgi:hypothetical protein
VDKVQKSCEPEEVDRVTGERTSKMVTPRESRFPQQPNRSWREYGSMVGAKLCSSSGRVSLRVSAAMKEQESNKALREARLTIGSKTLKEQTQERLSLKKWLRGSARSKPPRG